MKLQTLKTKLSFIKKQPRPILKMLMVDGNGLHCTDLETFITIKDNQGMSNGMQSLETLGMLPSNNNPDMVEAFPIYSFAHDHVKESITVNLDQLFYCLKFASKDAIRMFFNCVAFDNSHMVAINGHIMKYYRSNTLEGSFLIPQTSLKILESLCKSYKIKGEITIKFSCGFAYFETEYFKLNARLIDREFPKWQQVIPTKFNNEIIIKRLPKLKDIKPLLNRDNTVSIEAELGKIHLKIKDQEGLTVIGDCLMTDTFKLGFNFSYLDIACNGANDFKLKFNSELAPCEVNNAIVMPLKL